MPTFIYQMIHTDKPRDPFAERKVTVWRVFTDGRYPIQIGTHKARHQGTNQIVLEILRKYEGLPHKWRFPKSIPDPYLEIQAMATEGIYVCPI